MVPIGRHDLLKAWIAAILWLIVISVESSSLLSAHNTSRILYPLLHSLFGMAPESFEDLHFYIRKGGHVVGYAILSILLFRAWRATLPTAGKAKWAWHWATIALFGTAIVASLDEWHQSFLAGRTSSFHDVLIDTGGAVLFHVILLGVIGRRRRRLLFDSVG